MNNLRQKDFKLGAFHGKLVPENKFSEAKMRNDIFMIGKIGLVVSHNETIEIKIIAKEMPLEVGNKRGRCIDLFGIDKDWRPYIVELKLDSNSEVLSKVVNQVTNYKNIFNLIKTHIASEMTSSLFYKHFNFSGEAQRIVLSHSAYYNDIPLNNDPKVYKNEKDLYICSFYRMAVIKNAEEINLLNKKNNIGIVLLSILNK